MNEKQKLQRRIERLRIRNRNLNLRIRKLKIIGKKYSKATEFYDEFIEDDFVKMSPLTKEFVNQIGNEILQILKGDRYNVTSAQSST